MEEKESLASRPAYVPHSRREYPPNRLHLAPLSSSGAYFDKSATSTPDVPLACQRTPSTAQENHLSPSRPGGRAARRRIGACDAIITLCAPRSSVECCATHHALAIRWTLARLRSRNRSRCSAPDSVEAMFSLEVSENRHGSHRSQAAGTEL